MEEAAENGKESSNSAHANGMNELFEAPVSLKFHTLLIHISEGCNVCSDDSRQMHRGTAVAVRPSDPPLVLLGYLRSYTHLVGTESVGS